MKEYGMIILNLMFVVLIYKKTVKRWPVMKHNLNQMNLLKECVVKKNYRSRYYTCAF